MVEVAVSRTLSALAIVKVPVVEVADSTTMKVTASVVATTTP